MESKKAGRQGNWILPEHERMASVLDPCITLQSVVRGRFSDRRIEHATGRLDLLDWTAADLIGRRSESLLSPNQISYAEQFPEQPAIESLLATGVSVYSECLFVSGSGRDVLVAGTIIGIMRGGKLVRTRTTLRIICVEHLSPPQIASQRVRDLGGGPRVTRRPRPEHRLGGRGRCAS